MVLVDLCAKRVFATELFEWQVGRQFKSVALGAGERSWNRLLCLCLPLGVYFLLATPSLVIYTHQKTHGFKIVSAGKAVVGKGSSVEESTVLGGRVGIIEDG